MKFERLGSYIKQIRGLSYKPDEIHDEYQEGRIAVLKANNIQDNVLDDSNLIYIDKSKTKAEQKIQKGDILIAASSGSKEIVGKNIYFRNDYEAVFGAFCKVVRPNEKVNAEFISHFFKTPTYKNHIRNSIQGANINNLKNEHIDELKLVIPSLTEQKHIAEVLSTAEALIAERKQSIQLLDEYLKSTFLEMFGDPVKNEKGWEINRLSKYIVFIKNGLTRRGKFSKSELDIVLRLKDIRTNYIDYSDLDKITLTDKEKEQYKVDVGDLLFIRVNGNPDYVGRCAIVQKYEFPLYHNDHIIRVKVNRNELNPFFLSYFLNMEFGKNEIAKYRKTSAGQHTINQDGLNRVNMFIPPLKLQTQFASIVEKTEALKVQYKEHLHSLEIMYGALSQRAFRGELPGKYSKNAEVFNIAAEEKVSYKKAKK